MYLAYKEARHPKYERIKHLIEDPQFHQGEVDTEGAATTPTASPDGLLFESGQPNAHPSEANRVGEEDQLPARGAEAMDVGGNEGTTEFYREVNDDAMDESGGQAWTIGEDGEFSVPIDPSSMIDTLREAGVDAVTAEEAIDRVFGMRRTTKKSPTMVEVYGTSIHSHLQRRNLNIRGLGALDIRTLKPNGEPWDFNKRADRKEVKELINRTNPDWVIGSPPCTPFSIWNHGINYKKMTARRLRP